MRRVDNEHAFTLIELLIALFIIAVLVAFTVPSLRLYWQRTNDRVIQMELLHLIQMAKEEMHIRSKPVDMRIRDGRVVEIFVEDELIIKREFSQQGVLRSRSFPVNRDYLQFQPFNHLGDNHSIWYCSEVQSSPVWAIVTNRRGRTRVVYPDKKGVLLIGKRELRC
jgi:prepilin-type N-terminal cleavage/methylation domain-containing protein